MNIEVVEPKWEYPPTTLEMLDILTRHVEHCGRKCYKSEDKITEDSAPKFVRKICRRNHISVIEHATITVFITCSRSCSHQLVRHRIAAYSQESQRYCNYGKNGLKVICPPSIGVEPGVYSNDGGGAFYKQGWGFVNSGQQGNWLNTIFTSYREYLEALEAGIPPEDARYVLPNATKTEIAVTYNARIWRHVFQERALNKAAQWEIRGIFESILKDFTKRMPAMFEDLLDASN